MFPGCNMAASTVYKHRVLGVAILHPGNTHALIGKFCNYVLGRTSVLKVLNARRISPEHKYMLENVLDLFVL